MIINMETGHRFAVTLDGNARCLDDGCRFRTVFPPGMLSPAAWEMLQAHTSAHPAQALARCVPVA